jgi:hypothetical protein
MERRGHTLKGYIDVDPAALDADPGGRLAWIYEETFARRHGPSMARTWLRGSRRSSVVEFTAIAVAARNVCLSHFLTPNRLPLRRKIFLANS